MPVKGYKTVTLPQRIYDELLAYARQNYTTIPRFIAQLITPIGVRRGLTPPEREKTSPKQNSDIGNV